jgi:hypothetical protein
MSKPKPHADARQANVEALLGRLGTMMAILDHDTLRVSQAIRRSGLNDLLSPVVQDHQRIRQDLRRLQNELSEIWRAGQANNWE